MKKIIYFLDCFIFIFFFFHIFQGNNLLKMAFSPPFLVLRTGQLLRKGGIVGAACAEVGPEVVFVSQTLHPADGVMGSKFEKIGGRLTKFFLVKWTGLTCAYNTWEPQENIPEEMQHCYLPFNIVANERFIEDQKAEHIRRSNF